MGNEYQELLEEVRDYWLDLKEARKEVREAVKWQGQMLKKWEEATEALKAYERNHGITNDRSTNKEDTETD